MTVAINGQRVPTPFRSRCFLDTLDPKRPPRTRMCYTTDPRTGGQYKPGNVQGILNVVWHCMHGDEVDGIVLAPNPAYDEKDAMKCARYFQENARSASAPFIIADNGTALNIADLGTDRCWGSGSWSLSALDIEMDEEGPNGITAECIATAVEMAWWLTDHFGVQPQIPAVLDKDGNLQPFLGDVPTFLDEDKARDWRGHLFHANSPSRGKGDPGPALGIALLKSGFEGFDPRDHEHTKVWKTRQRELGFAEKDCDGIPGPMTRTAMLKKFGRATWAQRVAP